MSVIVRPISEDEIECFQRTMSVPFGYDPTPERATRFRKTFELDRLRAAFDGTEMVATFGAFTMSLSVPGGQLPMAGTTVVTVLPTHRRQGILRQMMHEHLREVRERGEVLAGLWASESSIYGRFGYGSASERAEMTLEKCWARFRDPVDLRGCIRLVDQQQALQLFPGIFERVAGGQPGMFARSAGWWENRVLLDPPDVRDGTTAHRRAVCEREGLAVGYLLYRWRSGTSERAARVEVIEMVAVDAAAERRLWQYLFGTDLVGSFRHWNLPTDAGLHWWLEQPRRVRRVIEDGLWLRLVDVKSGLEGRRYATPGALRIGVQDSVCPWNDGTYRLEVGEDGIAQCESAASPADMVTPVDALGAVYLGGHRFVDLARAGLISGAPDKLAEADRMFAWPRRPWVQEIF